MDAQLDKKSYGHPPHGSRGQTPTPPTLGPGDARRLREGAQRKQPPRHTGHQLDPQGDPVDGLGAIALGPRQADLPFHKPETVLNAKA